MLATLDHLLFSKALDLQLDTLKKGSCDSVACRHGKAKGAASLSEIVLPQKTTHPSEEEPTFHNQDKKGAKNNRLRSHTCSHTPEEEAYPDSPDAHQR